MNYPLATISILITALNCSDLAAVDAFVVRKHVETEQHLRIDELFSEFGQNKELPVDFELQALLALSHYPELKDIKIRFVIDDAGIPLSSRPHWVSILRSANNRTYLVVIASEFDGPRDVLLLKNQLFTAQTGIIGHELVHAVYYL